MSVARAPKIIFRSGGIIRTAVALGLLAAFALCVAQHAAYAGNVTLQPTTTGSAWTLTWPSSPGTNGYFLQSDGTGSTTWAPAGASSFALSSITSATTTASIDNTNNAITWAWGALSTQTALTLSTSSMTTGTLLSLANTGKSGASTVLGTSSTTTGAGYGMFSSMTGTGNSGYAGYFTNTATSGANYALFASNAAPNGYGIYATNNNSSGVALWCSSTYANGCGGNESWYNSSDIRLKAGIASLPPARGLGGVMQLRPVTFHWKDRARSQSEHIGLIAQEVEAVYPEVVAVGPGGMKSIVL